MIKRINRIKPTNSSGQILKSSLKFLLTYTYDNNDKQNA